MNERSRILIEIAKEYIRDRKEKNFLAMVGGSVGRGEADEFSDIDLAIYTTDPISSKASLKYKNEILQIEKQPLDYYPSLKEIETNPWSHRYLLESKLIHTAGKYHPHDKSKIDAFCKTKSCRQIMYDEVSKLVEGRIEHAYIRFKANKKFTAMIAILGAWAEAALLFQFFSTGSLATGSIIPSLRPFPSQLTCLKTVFRASATQSHNVLREVRAELRKQGSGFTFGIAPIQDELHEKKMRRLMKNNEELNLYWQTYSEMVWLFFETAKGESFESYREKFPSALKADLELLGFVEAGEGDLKEWGQMALELLKYAEIALEEKNDL
ncbi:nucleotidyltransferase domain-containing protein [Jeotgalibacillus proteolyticus]|uniref:Polymerase nucleotidyl transferase domain-containing protein n=1 Tax=Jeotgalibacillus proteolyticus TaxID=2082395 RepID=A0A2S5GCT2_9BACL|nr:nucleotidyltransferase domain-containing protein [Jeotgalibacillus proteolyticus]PPA70725.1 hypothetical protein C4B60_07980 [Jeotgalibacillus proteolyticus]